ncbi:MAG: SxtJ family membrane protein [Gemmatimonadales bacterium]
MLDHSDLYTAARGRRFALTLFIAFAVLAVIAEWRGRETVMLIFGGLAAVLAISGIAVPASLQPVERAWMALAHALSRITTPIFMSIVYFLVLAPVGLIRRAAGRNALVRQANNDSYWIARPQSETEKLRRRMERQF